MTESIVAVIDENEYHQNEAVAIMVNGHPDVESYSVADLPAGDIVFGNVVVERKSLSDFASTITDDERNIRKQAVEMTKHYDHAAVLVEASYREFEDAPHTELPPEAMWGVAASLWIRYGVPVFPVEDLQMLVDCGVRAGRKSVSEPDERAFVGATGAHGEADQTTRVLAAVDGLGPKRSQRLSEAFGSVRGVSSASHEELMAVDGIGEATAETVQAALWGEQDG